MLARMRPTHYTFNHIPKMGGNPLLEICRSQIGAAAISPHLTEHEIRLMDTARFERYRPFQHRGHSAAAGKV